MSRLTTFLAAAILFPAVIGAAAASTEKSREFVILAELNEANLAANDPDYATRIAKVVTGRISGLEPAYGDVLTLRTASGPAYSSRPASWNRSVELSFHGAKPHDLAAFLTTRIEELPNLPKTTDSGLRWTLDEMSGEIRCSTRETHVYIIGNSLDEAWEEGEYLKMKTLPGQPFSGCRSITWLGLAASGGNLTIEKRKALRDLFRKFGVSLGFSDVDVVH